MKLKLPQGKLQLFLAIAAVVVLGFTFFPAKVDVYRPASDPQCSVSCGAEIRFGFPYAWLDGSWTKTNTLIVSVRAQPEIDFGADYQLLAYDLGESLSLSVLLFAAVLFIGSQSATRSRN
jgi:hypothetical protein